METASLVISIFAVVISLVIAGFGIFLQFNMYKATTNQINAGERHLSDFSGEMKGLVAELRTLTSELVQIQHEQFNKMLDTYVNRPANAEAAAVKADASASDSQDVIERINALQREIAGKVDDERLRSEFARISEKAEAAAASAAEAARLAQSARGGGGRDVPPPNLRLQILGALREAEDGGERLTVLELASRLRDRFMVSRTDAAREIIHLIEAGSADTVEDSLKKKGYLPFGDKMVLTQSGRAELEETLARWKG